MTTVNVYLTYDGNCEEAFNFYRSVFSGEFSYMGRFGEIPAEAGGDTILDDQKNRVMHVSIPISKETILMGSDTGGEWATNFKEGNNFSVSVTADSREQADKLFNDWNCNGSNGHVAPVYCEYIKGDCRFPLFGNTL